MKIHWFQSPEFEQFRLFLDFHRNFFVNLNNRAGKSTVFNYNYICLRFPSCSNFYSTAVVQLEQGWLSHMCGSSAAMQYPRVKFPYTSNYNLTLKSIHTLNTQLYQTLTTHNTANIDKFTTKLKHAILHDFIICTVYNATKILSKALTSNTIYKSTDSITQCMHQSVYANLLPIQFTEQSSRKHSSSGFSHPCLTYMLTQYQSFGLHTWE